MKRINVSFNEIKQDIGREFTEFTEFNFPTFLRLALATRPPVDPVFFKRGN
jgi:hypothetical protein